MTYTYEDALKDSEQYFNGNNLSAKIFLDKYALRDENGEILENTPEKTHRRLAKEFARIEAKKFKNPYSEEYLFSLFDRFLHLIPQGSPTFAVGNNHQIASASNCFVVESPEDSYGGICKTDQELVQISKRRGGVGLDLSKLRPKGAITKNSSRSSTGIKSWMQRYSNSIREVGQSGRRGALMLTVSCHHPDIVDFITAKNNDTDVTGANISVRVSDEFLQAVEEHRDYELRFPVDSNEPKISTRTSASDIWNLIIKNAWTRAEPGVLFWDNIIRESIPDCYELFKTISTNPCGEITLSANDSCRLLVINLMKFVVNPFSSMAWFDFKAFYESAQIAQRLMDDLVDIELEKIEAIINKIIADPENSEIKQAELNLWKKMWNAAYQGRRTGLGITALGDVLAAVGIKYGTDYSIEFTEKIYQTLKFGSYRSSVDMAKELNTFPIWDWEKEKNNPFLNRIKNEQITMFVDGCPCGNCIDCEFTVFGNELFEDIQKYGRRNIANLTTAPVGTMSMLAGYKFGDTLIFGTTSGIEPLYTWKPYTRRKKGNPGDNNFRSDFVDQNGDHWMEFDVYHAGILAWRMLWQHNSKDPLDEKCPYFGASAEEIVWTQRVKLQAAAQKHVDHSISSTVNLPNDISEEEVAKIYNEAWKSGCKGITVYRDGCRTGVLVKKEDKKSDEIINQVNAPKRPRELQCDIYNISVKKEKYTVIVGLLGGLPYEVFCVSDYIDKHKHGTVIKNGKGNYIVKTDDGEVVLSKYLEDDAENVLLRLISTSLRHGVSIHFIVEQLQKTKGDFTSFNKCIARALKKYINDGTNSTEKCTCGSELIYQEGCLKCLNCSFSKCS